MRNLIRSFFRPVCPIDACAKAWMEWRLAWLADQFGPQTFVERPIVCPAHEFFPDPWDGSDESIQALLTRVCGYMDVAYDNVDWQFFLADRRTMLVDERGHDIPLAPAGVFEPGDERHHIHLDLAECAEPMWLVGTAAHELAHLKLSTAERAEADEFDDELLTDLTTVFFGLGIFRANSPRAWPSGFAVWPGTDVPCPDYMTAPMYGYALAHSAWLRRERRPAWMRYLRIDAREPFKQALRYLWETGDSAFHGGVAPAGVDDRT